MDAAAQLELLAMHSDRIAIEECIYRNALGTDLVDIDLWKSTYWPDATENHIWYDGNAHAFVDSAAQQVSNEMDTTSHHMSNVMIKLAGNSATVVSYMFAYCRMIGPDGTRTDLQTGSRTIDTMEKRDGEWRIMHRHVKPDWALTAPSSYDWNTVVRDGIVAKWGSHAADDPARGIFTA